MKKTYPGLGVLMFQPWDGLYCKQFYDIKLPSGEIVEHCWPNACKMLATDGSGRKWELKDNLEVRPSLTNPYDKFRNEGYKDLGDDY